jgi:hypothetical protein
MSPALARLLTRLYPRRWRDRYGAEFEMMLLEGSGGIRTSANVLWSAFSEHILSFRGVNMNRLSGSLAAILCAYVAVIAAGLNFYATIDDSPLATETRTTLGLSGGWNLVALGSIVALVGAICTLAPLAIGALRFALSQKRNDILIRIMVAPSLACVLAAWVMGTFLVLGSHWAPLPWAVAGDWTASAVWPSLQTRWMLGSITAALSIVLMVASFVCVYQAIQRTQFDELRFNFRNRPAVIHPLRLARIPGIITGAAILLMTIGIFVWGLTAIMQASAGFYEYFGPLHTTAFVSWIASLGVFAVSSVVALRAAPSLLKAAAN